MLEVVLRLRVINLNLVNYMYINAMMLQVRCMDFLSFHLMQMLLSKALTSYQESTMPQLLQEFLTKQDTSL